MTGVKGLDAMCESCGADITDYSITCDECWAEIEERYNGKIAELENENSVLKSLLQKIRDTEDRAKEVTPPIYSLADLIEHLERIVEEMKALASMSEGTISFDDLRNSLDADEEEGTANA